MPVLCVIKWAILLGSIDAASSISSVNTSVRVGRFATDLFARVASTTISSKCKPEEACGEWILPSSGELTPARIARVIAGRLGRFYTSPDIDERLAFLARKEASLAQQPDTVKRVPYFCSGCPHNTSTRVPEGSRALAGIGCHFMAQWMDRSTDTFTQMGGEGVSWVGQAPFTNDEHVFVNLGDGTYYHSGYLAIRQLTRTFWRACTTASSRVRARMPPLLAV